MEANGIAWRVKEAGFGERPYVTLSGPEGESQEFVDPPAALVRESMALVGHRPPADLVERLNAACPF